MLDRLGLGSGALSRKQVAILVGPNGAGKSNFLKKLAITIRQERNVAVVCNTAFDRFAGMRGIKRISASRSTRSPKDVIKKAVLLTLDAPDSRFHQIRMILEYCGYQSRIGFVVRGARDPDTAVDLADGRVGDPEDYEASFAFIRRSRTGEIVWVDPMEGALSFSRARDLVSVLRDEVQLRKMGLLTDIEVFLARSDGQIIELIHASSGELALISALIFLITLPAREPVILIDEPENSLHPSWQRQYVDKILTAVRYLNATIVIATHAPLIVTGALSSASGQVSVFQVKDGDPNLLDFSEMSRSGSIEEILSRAFDVVTPANHYVSERLAGVVSLLEKGEIAREAALDVVNDLDGQSADEKQREFFGAVRTLIDKVDAERRDGG